MLPQQSRLQLVGFDDGRANKGGFRVASHSSMRNNIKPHHIFGNWNRYFKLPYICFLEVSLFCSYFLFTLFHQKGAVAFTLDFSKSLSSFFLKDIRIHNPPAGITVGVGQIYYHKDLSAVINTSLQRFFEFPVSFPCAYPIIVNDNGNVKIELKNGTEIDLEFNENNIEQTSNIIKRYFQYFNKITESCIYHVQVAHQVQDTRMNLEVFVEFTHDYDTDTIFMDLSHTRFQEKFDLTSQNSILSTFDFSIPIFIGILNICALIIMGNQTYNLYRYCYAKATDSGQRPFDVFWKKFDKWDLFALLTHIVSIAASIMYILVGQDIEETIPPIVYLMAASSFLHSMLLVRYLKLKPSAFLILMVFYNSAIKILQFLVGCLTVFIGFLCFTNCIFGHLSENFATAMQGSAFLFCTMHGDSLKDFYDTMVLQYDINYYFGFFTATFWILFALSILYNITISIVQEMMSIEEYKLAHKDDEQTMPAFNIIFNDLALLSAKHSL
ncbi:hypothetical protein TVAG_334440 [Trichomonas vaginalis G3]|uniref:Polycystin cation channel PKD1/PKD2 domain-containing protein n=1 Tax=Trichomonas vaginalis (strain ATCC PRA-98 / G3) TaxID=412133 RepID=A2FQS0_TRIV3|nr:mucolipin family [Trichomonas vaginalis G3]EAX92741.1 hypothetical protein TVAG_334440 [Trichomonas vaginalis G3]KAI5515570.1 mucolipin family [Trichomonas vaginalis G3]|eukprot:XP_001305671.1 hypothetical protein [Trichomonas vaginalis G3]